MAAHFSPDPIPAPIVDIEPARSVHLRIAGLRVHLEFSGDLEIADRIADLWDHVRDLDAPRVGTDAEGTDAGGALCENPDIRLCFSGDRGPAAHGVTALEDGEVATYQVSTTLTRAVIDRLRGSRILLHAGAVEHVRHGVVVLVGASGAGKSTASTVLGRVGRYLTDELTIIEPSTFALTAYSKPVSRVDQDAARGRKRDVALASQGLDPITSAPAPRTVLLLDRDRGEQSSGGRGTLERLPMLDALSRVIEQSSSLWTVPGGLAALAELLAATGGALRARYREAAELEGLLGDPPEPLAEDWEVIDPTEAARAPERDEFCVMPFAQAISADGRLLVLREGSALTVEGISALVWDELHRSGPRSLEAVEVALIDLLGPHPESGDLVRMAVEQLVASSLLGAGRDAAAPAS